MNDQAAEHSPETTLPETKLPETGQPEHPAHEIAAAEAVAKGKAKGKVKDEAKAKDEAKDETPPPPTWPALPTVVVIGPAKGRWRIGRQFGPEPTSIHSATLTREQYAALLGDPELVVQLVDAPH